MAITFDPANRIIQLDSTTVSASQIWSRWVDWVALSDNAKYLPAFSQLGGVAPVALYIYLENGWRVRPLEQNQTLVITGNLLVQGGGNPIAPTIGSFQVLTVLEAPLAAQAIQVNSGSGVTAQDKTDIAQLVWSQTTASSNVAGTFGAALNFIRKMLSNRVSISGSNAVTTIYDDDKVTPIHVFDHTDERNRDPR